MKVAAILKRGGAWCQQIILSEKNKQYRQSAVPSKYCYAKRIALVLE